MSPPTLASPIAAVKEVFERKLAKGDGKALQEEENSSAKRPMLSKVFTGKHFSLPLPSESTATSPNSIWKGLNLTPSKRTSGECEATAKNVAESVRAIASLATQTQRKVFSTGSFYAKKLKRFQQDSPSSSRKNEGIVRSTSNASEVTMVSVVDLTCSSDDNDDNDGDGDIDIDNNNDNDDDDDDHVEAAGSEEILAKTSNDSSPKKDPPLKNKASPLSSNTDPQARDSKIDSPPKKDPPLENETLSEGSKTTPQASNSNVTFTIPKRKTPPESEGIEPRNNDDYKSLKYYDSDCAVCDSLIPIYKEKLFSYQDYCPKDNTLDKLAKKKSYHLFVLGTFTSERKQLLLEVLAPASMSAEAIKAESWKDVSYREVSKAFSERFGRISTEELRKLARGTFLVPKGMVSVKETLIAYRLLRTKAKTTHSSVEKKQSEDTSNVLVKESIRGNVLVKEKYTESSVEKVASKENANMVTGQPEEDRVGKEKPLKRIINKDYFSKCAKTATNGQGYTRSRCSLDELAMLLLKKKTVFESSDTPLKEDASSDDQGLREHDAEIESITYKPPTNKPVVEHEMSNNVLSEPKEINEGSTDLSKFKETNVGDDKISEFKDICEDDGDTSKTKDKLIPGVDGLHGKDAGHILKNDGFGHWLPTTREARFSHDIVKQDAYESTKAKETYEDEDETSEVNGTCGDNDESSKTKYTFEDNGKTSKLTDTYEDNHDSSIPNDTYKDNDETFEFNNNEKPELKGTIEDKTKGECEGNDEILVIKDSSEESGSAMVGSKGADGSVETNVEEHQGEEVLTDNRGGHLGTIQEANAILGELMSNMVDRVASVCRFEHHHPEGFETESFIGDETSHEPLKLEGLSEADISTISCDDDNEKEEKKRSLITVSAKQLLLLILPLFCFAGILRKLGFFDVSNSIFEGCFRTFFQLQTLGWLLSPIFEYGVKHPGLVGCYALFMIVLASYEASSRTKYTHDGQFVIIVQSLILSVGWVAAWAFGTILKPRPLWNPRYLLPIIGMLLGNSINGVSITLDNITTSVVEKQSEIELYLSFGANQHEAVSNIVVNAIRKGTTPFLNMMCVVGIVSIPGMMTGQILGGSSPLVAARYQAMIIFLIALSTLSTILISSYLTVMSAFCSHQILRPDRFVKNHKRSLARLILWAWGYVFGSENDLVQVSPNRMGGNGGSFLTSEEVNRNLHLPESSFEIRPLKKGSVVFDREGTNSLVQASGLYRYFQIGEGSDEYSDLTKRDSNRYQVLFHNLSFRINEGDLLLVSGPSGTGKSQLLRMMAGLNPLQKGTLHFQGMSWEDDFDGDLAVEWRRKVRYVTQNKIQIQGTPLQFIRKIQSFRSWEVDDDRNNAFSDYDFMKHVSHHIRQWGMSLECLDKEWSVLSGGESQRVLMALALASRPKILLFDESTSALDNESKLAVETSIKDFVEDHEGGVMWVSHDERQAERMMDDPESDGTNSH